MTLVTRKHSPVRLLVVDDEPSVGLYLDRLLSEHGYSPVVLYRGEDVQTRLERGERFDLAIVDVVMPGMSGDEVARLFRVAQPDGKVLFLTGYPGALFQARPVLWADEAFLVKPFTDDGLLEAISLLLNGRIDVPRRGHGPLPAPHSDDLLDL
jgi:CheY-like chemotaxis protein